MHEKLPADSPISISAPATMVRWRIVALLMAASFLCLFNRNSITVAGTEKLMEEFDLSTVQMGRVYLSYLLIYALAMIPGGWLIDRYGTRFALTAMGVGAGVCVMLTGLVGMLALPVMVMTSLMVIRGLTGLFSVPMFPASARTIAAWMPPENRSLANSLVTAAALLGAAGTFYLFGALMDLFGWKQAFVISGLITLAVTAVWIFYARSSPAEHKGVNAAELRLIASHSDSFSATNIITTQPLASPPRWHLLLFNRSLMLLTVSYGLAGYFQYVFFHWVQYYFSDVLKFGAKESRFYATLPNVAMAVGMFAGGWIADDLCRRVGSRWGRAGVAVTGLLTGAAFLYCGMIAEHQNWIVTWFSLAMGAVGMAEGPYWVTAIELGGRQGGASGAIFNTGGNLGGMIAPLATAWLSEHYDWDIALWATILVCVAAAILWMFIQPGEQTRSLQADVGASG